MIKIVKSIYKTILKKINYIKTFFYKRKEIKEEEFQDIVKGVLYFYKTYFDLYDVENKEGLQNIKIHLYDNYLIISFKKEDFNEEDYTKVINITKKLYLYMGKKYPEIIIPLMHLNIKKIEIMYLDHLLKNSDKDIRNIKNKEKDVDNLNDKNKKFKKIKYSKEKSNLFVVNNKEYYKYLPGIKNKNIF